MDFVENIRKRKRLVDFYCFSSRRGFLTLFVGFMLIVYLNPYGFHWISRSNQHFTDPLNRCIEDKLASFYYEVNECNANIRYSEDDSSFLPFIGNGFFGLSIYPQSSLFIKSSRVLSLPVDWYPIISASSGERSKEITVTHFVSGIIHRYHCFDNGLLISYYYYAHRTIPNYFSQEIKLVNPQDYSIDVFLSQPNLTSHAHSSLKTVRVPVGRGSEEYNLVTGTITDDNIKSDKLIAICILSKVVPKSINLKSHQTLTMHIPTIIYTKVISPSDNINADSSVQKKCYDILNEIKNKSLSQLKEDHAKVWNQLWQSGFGVSYSKAADVINGEHVNATLYYVLSHVRSYLHETRDYGNKKELMTLLQSTQGCYGGYYHTLQAQNLWGSLKNMEDVNKIVTFWLLTLEKQGCHRLISAGADGVIQAMLLSFGGFRFSDHHLEFIIHPKFLHRDYLFRRISYGIDTYINVSVTLQMNNKALLGVSVEGNNRSFYACDGGCIDDPVELGISTKYFPVKQTDPMTAILFITPDHKHIEEIKHTLHVKEVVEAPAQEHHVIALHKHGHHLAGLPNLFWGLVCSLIIIFHLFLFKLIYNEYCGKQDRPKARYTKF